MEQKPANHLAGASSPYLLEHAHNPVDWYPWGDEALQKAKREHKPIFLSVGYSACHWCHVMAREDFENADIAKIMNANFVCIKVDREERPDIDAQYMLAVQIMTQSGGWPMSVWITPDLKPFYGGTYFPPDQFKPLLEKVAALWRDENARVLAAADSLSQQMQLVTEASVRKSTAAVPPNITAVALAELTKTFDKTNGGFGSKPKFPEAPRLAFLLSEYRHTQKPELLTMLTKTLDGMADGGVFDQLGGGFHRYSTDSHWLIPHFEKMLYDQALLARIYFDAYEITKKPLYRQIGTSTLDFVLKEMTDDKSGGFYSTLDADSEGKEGQFYVWTPKQIEDILGQADSSRFEKTYGVTSEGNFEGGASVLFLQAPLSQAQDQAMVPLREKLLISRNKRVRPNTDDKILTAWNGLMLSALARGYQVTQQKRYLDAAVRDADFISKTMTLSDGKLLRSAHAGKAGSVPGFLDDYACLAEGLLDLYEATKEEKWLAQSRATVEQMIRRYWDKDGSGGFLSRGPDGAPVAHMKDAEDNATPSSNGIAAQVLTRLAALPSSGRPAGESAQFRREAAQTVKAFQPLISRAPTAVPTLLTVWETLSADEKTQVKTNKLPH